METKYPVLRRPKRKLCYVTTKENPCKQWEGTLTLEDVDKMFDDLDSSSQGDLIPTSPLLQTSDTETNQNETKVSYVQERGETMEELRGPKMGPEGDVLHPSTRSPSPKLEDLDISFKLDEPVQTSSPIEQQTDVEDVQKQDKQIRKVVSSVFTPKSQSKGRLIKKSDGSESESETTPIKVALTKRISLRKKAEASHKKEHVAEDKNNKKPQTPVSERKMPRNEDTESETAAAVEPEPELAGPEKNSERVLKQLPVQTSTPGIKDMTAFLQKLKDAIQSKPAYSRKTLAKVPSPLPEPEDNFLILEDDKPFIISIPSKNDTSKRQRQSRTSSTDRDSTTDKGTKKKQGKNDEVTEPDNDKDELTSPQEPSAEDLMEQKKPNKKKPQLKKVPPKKSSKAEDEPVDRANLEKGNNQKKKEFAETKMSKFSKDGKENTKSGRANSLKGNRKGLQRPDAVKDTVRVDVKEQSEEDSHKENTDIEDPGSLTDKERMKHDAGGKSQQNKQPGASERTPDDGCSSNTLQVLGKRKRKLTGQWWLSCPQSTDVTDNQQLTPKKSEQINEDAPAVVTSPVKAKKDNVLKESQKKHAPLLGQKTGRDKKTKRNKNRNARGDLADKGKATDEVFSIAEAEQSKEQELNDVPDQELVQEQSSPLLFTHRDHGFNSDKEMMKHDAGRKSKQNKPPVASERTSDDGCSSNALQVLGKRKRKATGQWWLSCPQSTDVTDNQQLTPKKSKQINEEAPAVVTSPVKAKKDNGYNSAAAAISLRQPKEQLGEAGPAKWKRKPQGNRWMVDSMSEDFGSVSSQSQQLPSKEAKPRKERKKLSKQSKSSKKGTMTASSKPLGGALVTSQKTKPYSFPKTGTSSPVTSKDKRQNKRGNVILHPAEENSPTDCATQSKTDTDVLCMDIGVSMDTHSSLYKTQDRICQQENMFKTPRSGPASLIDLHDYEESDITGYDIPLPRIHNVLSGSDLCALPLRPLILQPKDKANLTEWFKSLWSTTAGSDCDITPDHFDWYYYQDRAMGLQVDLNSGSICNGKILLGSFMKKPLWVDHSATTVFNLITSSLRVIIDGTESRFNPGQSFMVECGHAYSIQNLSSQPAVVYFTRISAESSS